MSGTRSTWDVGPCSNCGGDPIDPDGNACPRCGGSGRSDVIASAEWADMTDKPTPPRPKRGQVWTREDSSFEVLTDEPVGLGGEMWPVLITEPSGYRYAFSAPLLNGSYTPPRPELPPLSEWWVNVYPDGGGEPWATSGGADFLAFEDRIARVPLVPDLSRVVWCQGREVSS